MSGLYIIPLDLGDSLIEKSTSYLRMFIGEEEPRKRITTYIGGAKKKDLD